MELVLQPIDSHCCGQACVAMICGITLEQSIQLFGSSGKTNTAQLIEALREHGHTPFWGLTRIARGKILHEGLVIVKYKVKNKNWSHWVVHVTETNLYYDPATRVHKGPPQWLIAGGARAVSYLVVRWDKDPRK